MSLILVNNIEQQSMGEQLDLHTVKFRNRPHLTFKLQTKLT